MGSRSNLNATSSLNIDREEIEGGAVVLLKLSGTLDARTFEQLESKIADAFTGNIFRIILNMSEVREISSSGTGVIVDALSQTREQNGNVVLLSVTPSVQEVFDILDVADQFPMAHDLDSAIRMVQNTPAPIQEVDVPKSGEHTALTSVTRKSFED